MGPKIPIVVTHDFHANVCDEIVKLSTALITYKENPHLDTKECGLKAARIMAGILQGRYRPVQALVKPPMLYNIVYQNTRPHPFCPSLRRAAAWRRIPRFWRQTWPAATSTPMYPT